MTERRLVILHLETGHVVAAVDLGARLATVAQATGGSYVAVRLPSGDAVRVVADLLTALPVERDEDLLDRPLHYRVTQDTPPVSWTGAPTTVVDLPSKPGRDALSIWDGGTEPEIARQTLDNDGKLPTHPTGPPPGATRRLVAVAGEPLMYEP